MIARNVVLRSRPVGDPDASNFEIREAELPALREGEVRVRNEWMSVDPYMRLYMSEYSGAHEPLPPGSVLHGGACGVVIESRSPELAEGDQVVSPTNGWRSHYDAPAAALQKVDPRDGPLQWHLGVLGRSGMTAYAGVEQLDVRPGEVIYVSAAGGSVGMLALQLVKRKGGEVIGSVGSEEKREYLESRIGLDALINYRKEDLRSRLAELAPDGLDGYFDNVGGDHLEAAIDSMKTLGRIALCGAIALYNAPNYRVGPSNFFAVIEKGLNLRGFTATQSAPRRKEYLGNLARMLRNGEIVWDETVFEGLDAAPKALQAVLNGETRGKALVRLSQDSMGGVAG